MMLERSSPIEFLAVLAIGVAIQFLKRRQNTEAGSGKGLAYSSFWNETIEMLRAE